MGCALWEKGTHGRAPAETAGWGGGSEGALSWQAVTASALSAHGLAAVLPQALDFLAAK